MWLVRGGRDRRQRVSVQGNGTAEDYGKKDLGPRFSSEAFFVATAKAGGLARPRGGCRKGIPSARGRIYVKAT